MPRRKKGSSSAGDAGKSGSSLSINKGKPIQRNAANARERARMRVLSRAFCRLKTTLPWVPPDTKLSKLDTLRLAASYIAHLKGILSDDPYSSSDEPTSHPAMSLTWPFGFNRPTTLMEGNGSSEGGGSEAEEESVDGSSGCWEPESPTKDCIHLENSGQPDLLSNKHIQMQLTQEPSYKSHSNPSNLQNSDISNNNNIIPYNFHQNHHHHQHSNISYNNFQNDIIMTMS